MLTFEVFFIAITVRICYNVNRVAENKRFKFTVRR
jgi:hypothetical protein